MSKETVIAELRIIADDNTNRLTHKAVDLVERLANQDRVTATEPHPAYRAPEQNTSILGYCVLALGLIMLASQWL